MTDFQSFEEGDIVTLDKLDDRDAYTKYKDEMIGGVYVYVGQFNLGGCIILRSHPVLNPKFSGQIHHFLTGVQITLLQRPSK
jgi:hypothetical protein